MKTKPLLISLSMFFLLIGCTSKELSKEVDMRLHDIWAIESIDGVEYKKNKSDTLHPLIEIYVNDRRVHGTTNCNTINGELKLDGDRISFINIVYTEIACPGNFEKEFLSALESVTNYKIEKSRLMLFEDDTVRLIFRRID